MQNIQQSGPPNNSLETIANILSSPFLSIPAAGAKILRDYINRSKINNYKPKNYNYNQIENIAQAYGLDTAGIYNIHDILTNPEFQDNLTLNSYDFIEENMPETNKAMNGEEHDLEGLFKEYLDIKSSNYGNNWNSKEDIKEYNQYTTGFKSNLGAAAWDSLDAFLLKPISAMESLGKMPFNLIKQGVKYLDGKKNDPEFFKKLGNYYKSLITGEEVDGKNYTELYLETGFDDVLPQEWRNSSKGIDILNYVLSELSDVSNYLTFGTGLLAKGAAKGSKVAVKEAAKLGGKEATKLGTKEIAEKSGEEIGKRLLSKASMRQLGVDAGHAAFGGAVGGAASTYDLNPFLALGLGFFADPTEDIARVIYKRRKMNLKNSNIDNIKRSNYVEINPSAVSYSSVKKPITQTATKKPVTNTSSLNKSTQSVKNNNTTGYFVKSGSSETPLVRFSGEDDLSAIDNLSNSSKEINPKTITKPQRTESQSIAEKPLLPPDFLLPQDMPKNTSLPKDISSQQNTKAYDDWLKQQMQDNQRNQQILNAFDKYINKGK